VNAPVKLPHFEGWHLIGAFPDGKPDDIGSWLLVHNGEALLLEVPEGLSVRDVQEALRRTGTTLRFGTASHDHEDHLDLDVWGELVKAFPATRFMHPSSIHGDRLLHVGGEPVWLVKAPKHSLTDVVTVFRGVAMTGDIELGMLESVNDEVSERTRRRSMRRLAEFCDRCGYHVHSIVSAHLNDVRLSVHWPDLFEFQPGAR
jgi:hydroxyacylglutathione hydrolase